MPEHTTSHSRHRGRRLQDLLLGVPVFAKVMGIALGIAALLGGGMLWQIHQTWHEHLRRDLRTRGQIFADCVAARCDDLAKAGRPGEIPTHLRRSLEEFPDAAYLVVQDRNGVVLAEARPKEATPPSSQIRELSASAGASGQRLRAGISTARVDQEVGWLTLRLARMTAVIALLGAAAAWGLTRIFAHPIEELVALTRAVKAGQYGTTAPVRARDEVGELAAAFNEMTQALAQKEATRQQLQRKVISAGEEERKRIARELHDQTGQALTSQIAGLSMLENQSPDPATRTRLAALRQQAEQTLSEVHDLSVTLRPSVLDDVGLVPALQRHCRNFALQFGVKVNCAEIQMNGPRLPAEVELTLYRVVQEALTNAVRHGGAARAQVRIERTAAGVLATVQDNGCGFEASDWRKRCMEGDHLGLLGIEERVTLLGGSLDVESDPGQGTTVRAEIPVQEKS